ncbi:gastrin/cholecystokinin-like peptide [Sphaerodactylus townsendi]|uniref:Uncharacterized protein n=1 Tax=Sphaerodactylus townsendi TaxID=933632 RepID=A0ACB8EUD1_9SAUR|nr:gastrin/cholecystokinin-like peptide [Sphaerodactylus townsendi]
MHPKVFACLLLAALVATGLSKCMPTSRQVDSQTDKHRTAMSGPERIQKSDAERLIRREWPGEPSWYQKHLISQFLPHMYAAELAGKENSVQTDDDFQSWMDFGRRSLKDVNKDA